MEFCIHTPHVYLTRSLMARDSSQCAGKNQKIKETEYGIIYIPRNNDKVELRGSVYNEFAPSM